MKLWSDSWANGDRIASRYAAGRLDADSAGVTFSDNLNPHLAWSDLPPGTRSLVLICHDFDVPSRGDDVNKTDREIPSDLNHIHFGKGQTEAELTLTPGPHTLQLLLGDFEHVPHEAPVVSKLLHVTVVDGAANAGAPLPAEASARTPSPPDAAVYFV